MVRHSDFKETICEFSNDDFVFFLHLFLDCDSYYLFLRKKLNTLIFLKVTKLSLNFK